MADANLAVRQLAAALAATEIAYNIPINNPLHVLLTRYVKEFAKPLGLTDETLAAVLDFGTQYHTQEGGTGKDPK